MNMITRTRPNKPLLLLSDATKARPYPGLKRGRKQKDAFTVEIVLTVMMKAHDAKHARILAQHVAAFVPDDADRLTASFSSFIDPLDDSCFERERPAGKPCSVTRAKVVAVTPGTRGQ